MGDELHALQQMNYLVRLQTVGADGFTLAEFTHELLQLQVAAVPPRGCLDLAVNLTLKLALAFATLF
jgi:hypothetical protein